MTAALTEKARMAPFQVQAQSMAEAAWHGIAGRLLRACPDDPEVIERFLKYHGGDVDAAVAHIAKSLRHFLAGENIISQESPLAVQLKGGALSGYFNRGRRS